MKLPNGRRAIVDIRKLQEYCLDLEHFRGKHKARAFASIGFRQVNAEELRVAILAGAKESEAQLGKANRYGQRYTVDFDLVRHGRAVRIRSA